MTDKKNNPLEKARETVFRLYKFRPRSEHEIIEKLKKKGFSGDVIGQTIAHFKKIGFIDDRLFSQGWIRSRLNKPHGLHRIRHELKLKGIAPEIIAEMLEKGLEDYDEIAAIRQLAERRIKQYKGLDQQKAKRRLFEYLTRRGFRSSSIQKVIFGIKI